MIDRAFIQDMHDKVGAARGRGLWRRVPLTAGSSRRTELVAYLAIAQLTDGSVDTWFASFVNNCPVNMDQLKLELTGRELRPEFVQQVDWALQSGAGDLVGMPSDQQIEDGVIALARTIMDDGPIALYVSLRDEQTSAPVTEFWYPDGLPTDVMFTLLKRYAIQ